MTSERRDSNHPNAMSAWIRKQPELSSSPAKLGLDVQDLDFICHVYTEGKCLLLETKTYNATRSKAQQDTHGIIHRLCKAGAAFSLVKNNRGHTVLYGGYHVLTFSGAGPEDSDTLLWDGTPISLATLIATLAQCDGTIQHQEKASMISHGALWVPAKQLSFFGDELCSPMRPF